MLINGTIFIPMQALHTKNKKGKKTVVIVLTVLLCVGLAAGAYFMWRANQKAQVPTEPYTATSEGASFTVPAGVPQDAIKDYVLITENEQFKIRKDRQSQDYIITLYAIINRPDQYNDYRAQLKEFKQNALAVLTADGIDIKKVTIIYEPEEAKDL